MKTTIKDVAKESGVSIATVSRVLNNSGYVSTEIKSKVLQVVESLNYQVNAIAKSLKQEKTNMIGVIIPDISNPYFMQVAKGIEDEVEKDGYNLIFSSSNEDTNKEFKLLNLMYEKRVDAIILATSGENHTLINKIENAGIQVILVDRHYHEVMNSFTRISENNQLGAYKLTKYLIEQGYTKLGVINGSLDVNTGFDRYMGFMQAINEFGIEEDISFIYNGDFKKECGIKAVQQFTSQNEFPTAIIAFNNLMAIGAIKELFNKGLNIPEDIKIACYGEVEVMELINTLDIVYVKQQPHEMGRETGKILMRILNTEIKLHEISVYEPELIV